MGYLTAHLKPQPKSERVLPPPRDPYYPHESLRGGCQDPYWPIPRQLMASPLAIVERLIEDVERLRPDETSPPVMGSELVELGWDMRQLQIHSSLAVQLIRQRRNDRLLAIGRATDALLLFTGLGWVAFGALCLLRPGVVDMTAGDGWATGERRGNPRADEHRPERAGG